MGKKTDKFSTDLRNLLSACSAPAHELHVLGKQLTVLHGRLQQLEKLHNQRCKQIDPEGTTQYEREIAADSVIKKIDAQIDKLNPQFMKLMLRKREVKGDLKRLAKQVDKKADEFRAFLLKKSKSRNPFKSKKSLPGAVKFLNQVDSFVDDFAKMVR